LAKPNPTVFPNWMERDKVSKTLPGDILQVGHLNLQKGCGVQAAIGRSPSGRRAILSHHCGLA
jgi:hypothetical protein